jgi:uncharacterized cupredoxin-like copper-binding protein
MRSPRTMAVVVGGVALVAAACGGDDTEANGGLSGGGDQGRTVQVDMVDNAFEPDTLEVDQGEAVRFEITNTGDVAHDAFIGEAAAQEDHEDEMRAAEDDEADGEDHGMDGMGAEDDGDGITLEPGESAELMHTFDQPGTIEIGCHEPGHYDAGMKVTVTVG